LLSGLLFWFTAGQTGPKNKPLKDRA